MGGQGAAKSLNKDLTVGNPSTVLWRFCLPLVGSIIFQQAYTIADSLVAGKFVSEDALAAVGNGYMITLLFLAFAFGCNMGCSVTVSRLFGAKDYSGVKSAASTAFISTAILCAAVMCAGIVTASGLLSVIQTPDTIFADSKLYLDIYVWSLPFVFFYNVSTGIFAALGDSRTPFIFLACSSVANIFLDIVFVVTFGMGVSGVAWATFLCQGVSCILAVMFVLKRIRALYTTRQFARFDKGIFLDMAKIAIPSILQQSFITVGNIIIQGLINSFGTPVIAGYSAAIKLNNLVITAFTSIGTGMSNYVAQNIGAGKPDRVRAGFKAGVRLIWLISVPFIIAYIAFAPFFINLFMDSPTDLAVATGITILRVLSPFYFAVSLKLTADGVLRGASKMSLFMLSTFSDLIIRVVLAAILSHTALGVNGIWIGWIIGWIAGAAIACIAYRKQNWENIAISKTDYTH